jgi:hypothetical protein
MFKYWVYLDRVQDIWHISYERIHELTAFYTNVCNRWFEKDK